MHALREFALRMGDTTLVLSQQLGKWCGKGPALEEDLALTNTALDLLGQARQWLSYAGDLSQPTCDEDQLAFLRDGREFRNLLLVERPNGTYADTLVRQFLFDAWHYLALKDLVPSRDERIAGIAGKSLKEVTYHLRRSGDLIVRLGDGTDVSHRYIQVALDTLWSYTGEMFVADAVEEGLSTAGISFSPEALRKPWADLVAEVLARGTLKMPSLEAPMQSGGKCGLHTEHLGYLLAEMQALQRSYPGARW